MKKTILMQLFMLFAFSTICMAQKTKGVNIVNLQIPATGINMVNPPDCSTNFVLGQPDNGIRTIEAVTQGYRNSSSECVFDVRLFVPLHLEQHLGDNIKWEIDGESLPGNDRQISVPVPNGTTLVKVSYTIGNQQGAASRTFLVN